MLIILTILTVIWALVWRFTVSVLVGIAVFYFLPPQHETYTPSSKINAQFSVPVLKNENGECVLKRWTEFDSVQDKICTQSFEDISCFPIPQTKTGCDLKQINKNSIKGGVLGGLFLFIAGSMQQYGMQFTTAGKAGFTPVCPG